MCLFSVHYTLIGVILFPFLPTYFYPCQQSNYHPFISLSCVHSAKQPQQCGMSLNLSRVRGGGVASVPGSPARELSRLVQLQRDKLQALGGRLLDCEAELQDWEEAVGDANEVRNNHSYQGCYLQEMYYRCV